MERTYWTDELTAVPYNALVQILSANRSNAFSKAMASYLRVRGRMRWYLPPKSGFGHSRFATVAEAHQVPAAAQSMWAPIMEQLQDLNFDVLQYRLPDLIGDRTSCICLLRHSSGQTLATVEWMKIRGPVAEETALVMELNSYAADDPEVLTGSIKQEHILMSEAFRPSFVDLKFLPSSKPLRLVWQLHQQRIANREFYSLEADAAVQMHLQRTERRFQWLLERGILRPLSHREVVKVKALVFQKLPS